MINYITKEFAFQETPSVSTEWKLKSEKEKIDLVASFLTKNSIYVNFRVVKAQDNGHVILSTEENIPASERGVLLIDLEEILKKKIDKGISIWLEPVGDKSKLRNLRGINFNKNT
jgi:hypothetical protein